ncbi:AAA family ATPase [Auraticoccus monumenti]|uniref:AAA domain-containing protein n=1 Tax=Auraticoccus monumenti TaxID=675864 RepID=A0A1G7CTS2_9ACTN|nr:AAA family ATPase [Auraticoccus monumenti]SDE41895.1 hypothetical protein SAMN04489747_3355 [Auraticoccus monumenti]
MLRRQPPPRAGREVVFLGGVPGAGKTTALRQVPATAGTRVLDPEQVGLALRRRVGEGVPYAWLRPVVHTLQYLRVLRHLLLPPAGVERLLVHDTATRPWLRHLEARLARLFGWRPSLVLVGVTREEALRGQQARGRVLDPGRFDGHWRRWQRLRRELADGALADGALVRPPEPWSRVVLVGRDRAVAELTEPARPVVARRAPLR